MSSVPKPMEVPQPFKLACMKMLKRVQVCMCLFSFISSVALQSPNSSADWCDLHEIEPRVLSCLESHLIVGIASGSFTTSTARELLMFLLDIPTVTGSQVSCLPWSYLLLAIEVDMPWKPAPEEYGKCFEVWNDEHLRECISPLFQVLPNNRVATIVSQFFLLLSPLC